MSDRTDERTLRNMLTWLSDCDGLCDEVGETARLADRCWKALDRLLAADAAETASLREETQTLREHRDEARCQRDAALHAGLKLKAKLDAAVADRDRLTEALDLIGHGWDGDEFNDPADLVEEYASIARAALAGREGSDDA